jgi:hypothetical protein
MKAIQIIIYSIFIISYQVKSQADLIYSINENDLNNISIVDGNYLVCNNNKIVIEMQYGFITDLIWIDFFSNSEYPTNTEFNTSSYYFEFEFHNLNNNGSNLGEVIFDWLGAGPEDHSEIISTFNKKVKTPTL